MATGNATISTASAILKDQWPEDRVEEAFYKDFPFLGIIEKDSDDEAFLGSGTAYVAIQHGGQQGVASTLSDAQSNVSSNNYKRFAVPLAEIYGVARIAGRLIRAGKDKKGALVKAYDREMETAMTSVRRKMAQAIWGNGGGAIGQILAGSSVAATTITLADPTQAFWFDTDMVLRLSADNGLSGSLRAGTVTVERVNRRTGVITCTGNVTDGIAAAAAGDYIFQRGTHGVTTTFPTGLPGWIPTTDPSSDTFLGLTAPGRGADPDRLAGLRYLAGSGGPIEKTVQDAFGFAKQEGTRPDLLLMNPMDLQALCTALNSSRAGFTRTERKAYELDIGYETVKIITPVGEVDVIGDSGCPRSSAWAVNTSVWTLYSLGKAPMLIQEDGLVIRAISDADAYEARIYAGLNLACRNPHENMYIAL